MTQIDLNKPPEGYKVSIQTKEHPYERGVRLFKEASLFLGEWPALD